MGIKLTRAQVAARYGGKSIRTIIRWTDDTKYAYLNFPKPVRFGGRDMLYDLDELEQWEKERAAKVKRPKATISLDDLDLEAVA